MKTDEPLLVNGRQLAALLGVAATSLSRLRSEGLPCSQTGGGRGRGSVYDAVECCAWWRARQSRPETDAGADARREYHRALTRRVDLEVRTRAGELVSVDEVILAGQHFVKAWTAKIRALPRQLVMAGLITREREQGAADLCREVLAEISRWKTVEDVQRANRAPGRRTA